MNLDNLKATIAKAKEGFVVRCPYERKEHKVETPEEMRVIFSALEAAIYLAEIAEGVKENPRASWAHEHLMEALQKFKDVA